MFPIYLFFFKNFTPQANVHITKHHIVHIITFHITLKTVFVHWGHWGTARKRYRPVWPSERLNKKIRRYFLRIKIFCLQGQSELWLDSNSRNLKNCRCWHWKLTVANILDDYIFLTYMIRKVRWNNKNRINVEKIPRGKLLPMWWCNVAPDLIYIM